MPAEICAVEDVFFLGKPPTDSSQKEAIQKFVTDHRSGTHREFVMEPMLFLDHEINVMMKFQDLHVSKTEGARKYFLVQVMYEIGRWANSKQAIKLLEQRIFSRKHGK